LAKLYRSYVVIIDCPKYIWYTLQVSTSSDHLSSCCLFVMEPEGSLSCSQDPTTGHCPEPDESSLHGYAEMCVLYKVCHIIWFFVKLFLVGISLKLSKTS